MFNLYVVLVILGIIQGVAEFIPISSSGHLVIAEQFSYFKSTLQALNDKGNLFINVSLHIATLIALMLYMRKDIYAIIKGFFQGIITWDFQKPEVKISFNIIIASIPAALIGLLINDFIENIFSSARVAFILLIINGIILILTKIIQVKDRKLDEIGLVRSIGVGLCQAFAILPGISRSGMTITGGMLVGLSPMESARFSFLMAIPVIIGAGLLEGIKAVKAGIPERIIPALTVSAIITVAVGLIALKVLFALVKNVRIYLFGFYTIAVGIAGLVVFYLIK